MTLRQSLSAILPDLEALAVPGLDEAARERIAAQLPRLADAVREADLDEDEGDDEAEEDAETGDLEERVDELEDEVWELEEERDKLKRKLRRLRRECAALVSALASPIVIATPDVPNLFTPLRFGKGRFWTEDSAGEKPLSHLLRTKRRTT
jgi:hypothetical protein